MRPKPGRKKKKIFQRKTKFSNKKKEGETN